MFEEADLRLTMDFSKPIRNPHLIRTTNRPLLPGLDDAAVLFEIDPAAVERPGRPSLMARKNEQKLQTWVY